MPTQDQTNAQGLIAGVEQSTTLVARRSSTTASPRVLGPSTRSRWTGDGRWAIRQRALMRRRAIAQGGIVIGLCMLVSLSAIVTKTTMVRTGLEPLSRVGALDSRSGLNVDSVSKLGKASTSIGEPIRDPLSVEWATMPVPELLHNPETADEGAQNDTTSTAKAASEPAIEIVPDADEYVTDTSIRYFNGRPVRPARTISMEVTAYSPDARSCPGTDDGLTSTSHNVWTNAMRLVAADPRVLPMGSMITVPGYDDNRIVPVLDIGGAIKGHRLDVLYPTHQVARRWGRQKLQVTVWEYADGLPKDDLRRIRDSRN